MQGLKVAKLVVSREACLGRFAGALAELLHLDHCVDNPFKLERESRRVGYGRLLTPAIGLLDGVREGGNTNLVRCRLGRGFSRSI